MERYQRQIKDDSRLPNAYGQNFVDGAAAGSHVAGAVERLGDMVQKAGAVMQRRQDEWDSTRVMEANNEFVKRMTLYLDDPDKGVFNTRKLGLARGVTQQSDGDADKMIREIENGLENNAQKEAFRTMAARSKMPFWREASNHEAREVGAYREQVFKNTLNDGMNITMRDPMDEEAFKTAAVQGATAIRAQYVGAAKEVQDAAIDEYVSGLETARIAAVAEDNPLLGEELIKNSPYLTPQDAQKLKNSIGPRADGYKTQAFVDEFIQKFPPGKEREGVDWIRKNYAGPEEERYVSAYRQRIGEATMNEVNAENELRKQQAANFDQLYKNTWAQGRNPSQDDLDAMLQKNVISPAQHRQGIGFSQVAVMRAQVTQSLAKNPNWTSLTPQQQDERVMRYMGVTKEERNAVLDHIKAGVLDGSMTNAEIDAHWQNGRITASEKERFKGIGAQITKEQKAFVADQKKALGSDIKTIKIPGKDDKTFLSIAQNKFNENVARLDPMSKTYRMDVMDARRDALVAGIEASGRERVESAWFRFGDNDLQPTKFGLRVTQALTALEEQTGKVQEYAPEFKADAIDLTPAPPAGTGNIGLDMVGGQGRISGQFNDWRAYRNGQHNGIDVAAPEGTLIVSPDVGAPLRVRKIVLGSPSKGAGNYVIVEGRLPDGRLLEMQISHMKNGSVPLKVGDIVSPGDLIGQVGNTGMTSDRAMGGITAWYDGKKSGHHMDLKMRIDGKPIDPEKVQLGPTRARAVEALDNMLFGGKDGI